MKLKIDEIYPNPENPRTEFSEKALDELARSIADHGLMEPIVVVKSRRGYMIVAGERRWRACRRAGVKHPPVRVIRADKKKIAELALVENLQREDLNLIEEARGYRRLMALGMSMEEVSEKMGYKQVHRIRDRLDLLKLDPKFQNLLVQKALTPSQAYEMSRLPIPKQHMLFDRIREGKADTYNKLRALANALLNPPPQQETIDAALPAEEKTVADKYDQMVERLCRFVNASFDKEDLKVLERAVRSSIDMNLEKLELIIQHLQKIKTAMVRAQAARQAT